MEILQKRMHKESRFDATVRDRDPDVSRELQQADSGSRSCDVLERAPWPV